MNKRPPTLTRDKNSDNDYTLKLGSDKYDSDVWIGVGPVSLNVKPTSEGLIIDAWPNGNEADCEWPLATMAVMFTDAEDEGGKPCPHEPPCPPLEIP